MRKTQQLGQEGEDTAVAYLEGAGMRVLERNWRCPQGEIDIVAIDGRCLVVCEVKTRRSTVAGQPAEAVTPQKVARLRRLTGAWLAAQRGHFDDVRIDVVTILRPPGGVPDVRHIRGVG
jgi:putative endonuclease